MADLFLTDLLYQERLDLGARQLWLGSTMLSLAATQLDDGLGTHKPINRDVYSRFCHRAFSLV